MANCPMRQEERRRQFRFGDVILGCPQVVGTPTCLIALWACIQEPAIRIKRTTCGLEAACALAEPRGSDNVLPINGSISQLPRLAVHSSPSLNGPPREAFMPFIIRPFRRFTVQRAVG